MKVVLLFDHLHARTEAIRYGVEFSARMESVLVLLMLLHLDGEGAGSNQGNGHLSASVEQAFAPHVAMARRAGVPVELILRVGDPFSEFMKYLAETRTVHTIVWAGDRKVLHQKQRGESPHWLVRIRDAVDLPVVSPSRKA